MSDAAATDLALFVLRGTVGVVMLAHGWNHVFGGGRIAGTARWFDRLGMRPGLVHAWLASATELGAGVLLLVGLLTPLAASAVVGVMLVAWITNHRGNGFFIFRPGEGWEYVMTLTFVSAAVAVLGPGAWSLDAVFDLPRLDGERGWLVAILVGAVPAGLLLAVAWRPPRKDTRAQS